MTEPQQDKRSERSGAPAPVPVQPATGEWAGQPARTPALAGLAHGEPAQRRPAPNPAGIRGPHVAPPPFTAPVAALRRAADWHAGRGAGHRCAEGKAATSVPPQHASSPGGPVIRRKWVERKPDGSGTWEFEGPPDAPSGYYTPDQSLGLRSAQLRWRGDDGQLYDDVNGGPGPPAAELTKRARPSLETKPARTFSLATFDGLVRPPLIPNPRYKHVSPRPTLTLEMARNAQTQPGKRTADYLTATQDGSRNLAEADINRDHVLSNRSIDRLVTAIVPYLRDHPATDDALFRAWTRALVGDHPDLQEDVDKALKTALDSGACGKLVDLLARAPNNVLFGQKTPNQHVGHALDVPTYRGRIAPFAQRILEATLALAPLVAHTADPRAVLDAISQSIDTKGGSYVSSTTPIGEEATHRRPIVSDDSGLVFYTSSQAPMARSNSALGRLQHRSPRPPAAPSPLASSLVPAPAGSAIPPIIQLTSPATLGSPVSTQPAASPLAAAALALSPVAPPAASLALPMVLPPASGPAGPAGGNPRQLLQDRTLQALDLLRDRWRQREDLPTGVPLQYHDFRETIHSISVAPPDLSIAQIEADAQEWLENARSRWNL